MPAPYRPPVHDAPAAQPATAPHRHDAVARTDRTRQHDQRTDASGRCSDERARRTRSDARRRSSRDQTGRSRARSRRVSLVLAAIGVVVFIIGAFTGTRSRVAGVPRQLAVLHHDLVGGVDVRRRAAHHDRALVAPDRSACSKGTSRFFRSRSCCCCSSSSSDAITSFRGRRTPPTIHEKRSSSNPPFFTSRAICRALRRARRSERLVHLHVGAARRRASCPSGAPRGRAEFASACAVDSATSAVSFTRRTRCRASSRSSSCSAFAFGWIVLVVGSLDVARPALPEHDVRVVVLHGRLGRRAHELVAPRDGVAQATRTLRPHQDKHFHDLGKLCFAFTAFWGYLTFGQYLVIWYGNMAGGDALDAAAADRSRGSPLTHGRRDADVRASVLRAAVASAAKVYLADDDRSSRCASIVGSGCTATSRSIRRSTA